MSNTFADEVQWLLDNPEFDERPATLLEFLGPRYLNIEQRVRRRIKAELEAIMGAEVSGERMTLYPEALITGGIGIGKTTVASIVLPYMAHWVLCLKDPQDHFGLMAGSRIAFMQMSTSEKQALEVVFGDIKARIAHSPWFQKYPYSRDYKNQLRFDKDIWIIPGDSSETTFEGYNILGGILDEGDSHKVTANKDYAEQGYTTISSRITSRFQDRGFLLVIGQMKKAVGFMADKYKEYSNDPEKYAVRLAIWDAMDKELYEDDNGNIKTFSYDVARKMIVPNGLVVDSNTILEIPILYLKDFRNNSAKALRDLAGIPPNVEDPFIAMPLKIEACRDRYLARYGPGYSSPVAPDGKFASWFKADSSLKRVIHVDIGYASGGDALGLAMGHVREQVDIDGELKPYIVMDLLLRMTAPSGGQILMSDMRNVIYQLKGDMRFRIAKVTFDGFESTDTMQQLQKRKIETQYVSMDRSLLPYYDLRDAIYENRIEWPHYIANVRKGADINETEILYKELSELMDMGKKVDHPVGGSKDVADAVAGVVSVLMGDRRFSKRRIDMGNDISSNGPPSLQTSSREHPAVRGDFRPPPAPLPPKMRT